MDQRWAPFAVAGTALAVLLAVPVARAVSRPDRPARPAAAESPSPSPSALPSVGASFSATPSPSPSPTPAPTTAAPSPTAVATRTASPSPARTPVATPLTGDEYIATYCRDAAHTNGDISVAIQYCRWPGAANDAYTVTLTYRGDWVWRSEKVDYGNGPQEIYPSAGQPSCVSDHRVNPQYDGEHVHELPAGRRTVTVSLMAYHCGDLNDPPRSDDPDYEDADHPGTATVTLVIPDLP
jgi:hypothetical protein